MVIARQGPVGAPAGTRVGDGHALRGGFWNALALPAALVSAGLTSPTAQADCIDDAARLHGVNAHVLRAIGWHESRLQPQALAHNRNGTRDIGAFQINSRHLPRLAALGVAPAALSDGCVSASVAAWHYAQQVARLGNTWQAVGAYHSHTPARNAWYANAIARVLMGWGVAPRGALPFDPARTLAPTAPGAAGARPTPASPERHSPDAVETPLFDDALNAETDADTRVPSRVIQGAGDAATDGSAPAASSLRTVP